MGRCAGFNKSLGPIRTPLRAATVGWLLILWRRHFRAGGPKPSGFALAVRTGVTCLLMFLPEALLYLGQPALAPPTTATSSFALQLDGMGCEACQLHVQRVLEASSGVVAAEVDYTTGRAQVTVADGWGFNLTRASEILSEDGYELLNTTSAKGSQAAPGGLLGKGPAAAAAVAAGRGSSAPSRAEL